MTPLLLFIIDATNRYLGPLREPLNFFLRGIKAKYCVFLLPTK